MWHKRKKTIAGLIVAIVCLVISMTASMASGQVELAAKLEIKATEKITNFEGGILYKTRQSDGTVKDVLAFDDGRVEVYDPEKHASLFVKFKSSTKSKEIIDKAKDKIPVTIWISDIDHKDIDKKIKENLKIVDIDKESSDKVQKYIEEKRKAEKSAYTERNRQFSAKYVEEKDVIFTSTYAPLVIASVERTKIEGLYKDDSVLSVEIFTDAKKEEEMAFSTPNVNANYTRDTMNLKGIGVKVGVVELGYPDLTQSELSDRNIILDVPSSTALSRLSSHATIVTDIIVGKTQGLAPNATIYAVAALNRSQDYQKIEWLLDQGVLIINYSSGYTDIRGDYSDMAKWIDHLGSQHNVLFVKSAGNERLGNYDISDPGMAYNSVVVGSIHDHDSASEPYWLDDTFSSWSAYTENSGGYKPDLTAPGEGIDVVGYSNNSGTSFSAPHVSGILAQLLPLQSSLPRNTTFKAILAAGTFHKTANDYGAYFLSPHYSNKEGAGVVDAKSAYSVISGNDFVNVNLTSSQFPYEKTITVSATNKPVRVALSWEKKITVDTTPHVGVAVNERLLTDLDLEIYGPTGKFITDSISPNNNLELVEFTPSVTGTYKIKVHSYAMQNSEEYISLAWTQQ